MIDYEKDYLYHIFNSKYSLSRNYFGVQIIERKSKRRFVKRTSDKFEEEMRYEGNPFALKSKPTSKQKWFLDKFRILSQTKN